MRPPGRRLSPPPPPPPSAVAGGGGGAPAALANAVVHKANGAHKAPAPRASAPGARGGWAAGPPSSAPAPGGGQEGGEPTVKDNLLGATKMLEAAKALPTGSTRDLEVTRWENKVAELKLAEHAAKPLPSRLASLQQRLFNAAAAHEAAIAEVKRLNGVLTGALEAAKGTEAALLAVKEEEARLEAEIRTSGPAPAPVPPAPDIWPDLAGLLQGLQGMVLPLELQGFAANLWLKAQAVAQPAPAEGPGPEPAGAGAPSLPSSSPPASSAPGGGPVPAQGAGPTGVPMDISMDREQHEGQPSAKRAALSGTVILVPDSPPETVPAAVVTPDMVADAQWLLAAGQAQAQAGAVVLQAATAQAAALATCSEPSQPQ